MAFNELGKKSAPGIDDQTAADCENGLEDKLESLLNRTKPDSHKAPTVSRERYRNQAARRRGRLESPQSYEDKWRRIIDNWKASNISRAEYCRRENISYYKFIDWKKKLASDNSPSGLTLLKLEASDFGQNLNVPVFPLPRFPIRFWLKDFFIDGTVSKFPAVQCASGW